MPVQQLLVSWKDHNGALVSVFENLLKQNAFVDCTLAAEGQYLKAHKMVLSACSSYFELLFSQESEKNPIVILKDVKFQELEAAVNFMYRGEVEVCEDRLTTFLEVAESLQIKGLGRDGKTQDSRGKSPSRKSSETSVPPKAHSRKEVSFSQSENTGDSCITIASDKNSNENSSHHLPPHRESLRSSPFSSSLTPSCSLASVSTCFPVGAEINSDGDKVENSPCSSPSATTFPLRDTVPLGVDTIIKTEPVSDTYLDERSNETERDLDDVTMMEDQEDWDEPNIEYIGDDHASNQDDPGFSVTRMKTEESTLAPVEHTYPEDSAWTEDSDGGGDDRRAPHFAGVFFQEHQPRPDPGPDLAAAPAPGRAMGDASARQGVPAGSARLGITTAAPRGGRYQCHDCGYSTFAPSLLARHQLVHTGEKPYTCTVCSYAASREDRLKQHMRIHTGEKPYKCTVCSYAASREDHLKQHMRIHTGEKPYKCTVCTFATTQLVHLKTHMRTHTGEKPYKCSVCTYAATRQDILKFHMRKHTG